MLVVDGDEETWVCGKATSVLQVGWPRRIQGYAESAVAVGVSCSQAFEAVSGPPISPRSSPKSSLSRSLPSSNSQQATTQLISSLFDPSLVDICIFTNGQMVNTLLRFAPLYLTCQSQPGLQNTMIMCFVPSSRT